MKDLVALGRQLNEWQEKLDFYKIEEAKIVDLEQKFAAQKKIKEAKNRISELENQLKENSPIIEYDTSLPIDINLKEGPDITTLHQALDLFVQQKDKLDHKSTIEEVEEIEKLKSAFIESIFGDYQSKVSAIPVLKDKVVINLFENIITSESLPDTLISEINQIRTDSNNYHFEHRSVIVSALTLSVLSWKKFDPKKVILLLDFLMGFEEDIWQRALVGVILSAIIHQNRLQRYQLTKRLEVLQEIEKIQIGIYIIDSILRNQLYKLVIFPDAIETHDFLTKTPYNWFFPFVKDNEILNDALNNSEQDIEEERFIKFIHQAPFVSAFKYVLCDLLLKGKLMFEGEEEKGDSEKFEALDDVLRLQLSRGLQPYYNIISEVFLYFKFYPKQRIEELFDNKITLAETKLKNIILGRTQKLMLESYMLFEKKDYGPCVNKLKELLNIEPNQISALKLTSRCYEGLNKYSEALNYYMQLEKLKPSDEFLLFKIGYCLHKTKQFRKSNEYLLKCKTLNPKSAGISSFIADNHYELDNYDIAIDFANESLTLEKNNEHALNILSLCYSRLKKNKEALMYCMKLHELDKENPFVLIRIAENYSSLGESSKALEFASNAFILKSSSPIVMFSYARILFEWKDFSKARIMLNNVLRLKDSNHYSGIVYGNLGHIALFDGNTSKAMEYYRRCVLEFDNIKEFEEKFDFDLKYVIENDVEEDFYLKLKEELIMYWQENK